MKNLNREKIDRYLLYKMDEKTRQEFEAQIASDEVLAEEVELQREAMSMLESIGDQKIKTSLDQIHDKVVVQSNASSLSRRRWIIVIFSMLILMLLGYFFIKNSFNSSITPDRAFNDYYEPYQLSFATREGSQNLQIQQINVLYNQQRYQEALPLLEQLIRQDKDTKLQMAAGICALEINETDKALKYFNDLINLKDPIFQNQAQWYAAMTMLKAGNLSLAKEYLQVLVNSNNTFKSAESGELLQLLK